MHRPVSPVKSIGEDSGGTYKIAPPTVPVTQAQFVTPIIMNIPATFSWVSENGQHGQNVAAINRA